MTTTLPDKFNRTCLRAAVLAAVLVPLAACGSAERAQVVTLQGAGAVYCYETIGGITCHGVPDATRAARLVNYTGPSPDRYPQPAPAPAPILAAPTPVGFWAIDPEPIPQPSRIERALKASGGQAPTADPASVRGGWILLAPANPQTGAADGAAYDPALDPALDPDDFEPYGAQGPDDGAGGTAQMGQAATL